MFIRLKSLFPDWDSHSHNMMGAKEKKIANIVNFAYV